MEELELEGIMKNFSRRRLRRTRTKSTTRSTRSSPPPAALPETMARLIGALQTRSDVTVGSAEILSPPEQTV